MKANCANYCSADRYLSLIFTDTYLSGCIIEQANALVTDAIVKMCCFFTMKSVC